MFLPPDDGMALRGGREGPSGPIKFSLNMSSSSLSSLHEMISLGRYDLAFLFCPFTFAHLPSSAEKQLGSQCIANQLRSAFSFVPPILPWCRKHCKQGILLHLFACLLYTGVLELKSHLTRQSGRNNDRERATFPSCRGRSKRP